MSGAASAIAMLRLPVKEKVQTNQLERPHQRRFRDRRLYREMHRDANKKRIIRYGDPISKEEKNVKISIGSIHWKV